MRIEHLTLKVSGRSLYPLWDVSLRVEDNEVVAVLGESGGGKTSLAWAAVGRPLPGQEVVAGKVYFKGRDILNMPPAERRRIYFKELSLVPQNAPDTLHPTQTVARTLWEIYTAKNGKGEAREAVLPLLEELGLPEEVLRKYPHQLSGGQKQRVALLLALLNRPQLVVLDEPTSALDVLTQKKVKDLLGKINREHGTGILFFTHDVSLAFSLARRVVVLYGGQVVEELPAFKRESALHPYTRGLLASGPRIGDPPLSRRGIPGYALPLLAPPQACSFAARCPQARDVCRKEAPPLVKVGEGQVRCFAYAAGAQRGG
ncbi:ABC transporter ATP-binding protein [Desulfovirgula thermocuniculi]|uniref:ABC transporter ATP-binding protein n=1 Tax=Desulfovirgula thermocuniculi TaxID=348842 RepID=UPI00040CACF4|nr:ABC transporter ATP-binding protein [Desulfovirgula thermocuniculi]